MASKTAIFAPVVPLIGPNPPFDGQVGHALLQAISHFPFGPPTLFPKLLLLFCSLIPMTSTVLLGKLVLLRMSFTCLVSCGLRFSCSCAMTRVPCSPPENRPQVRVICNPFDLTLRNRISRFNQSQYTQKEVFDRRVPTHPLPHAHRLPQPPHCDERLPRQLWNSQNHLAGTPIAVLSFHNWRSSSVSNYLRIVR